MSDRMFASCCYGSAAQHLPNAPCPQERMDKARADYIAAIDMVCVTDADRRARRLELEKAAVRYAAAKRAAGGDQSNA